ncbi:MAG TPA: carboxypeptidase regulatory-like domain-containing protein [Terriglobales bacterium]|jgi:hypothetical protein|nr:carboxypeptidase regulatory-like domain-containing protein [Terriglobales bacterium]
MDADFRRKVAVSRLLVVLMAVVLALTSCLPLTAQVLKGSISGTVMDPQGAVISGAQVKVKNVETGVEYTTTSEPSGLFRLNLLPVGTYDLTVAAAGFQTVSMRQQPVVAGRDTSLGGVKMTVGAAATTVEVTAEAPLITTTQAQITNNFSTAQVSSWAGIQENQGLDNMAQFVPGVAPTRSDNFSNTNGGGFSSNGIRGRNNDQEIDGQNNNDNSVGGPGLFVSNPNFVQEYVLVTNQFGAEYGRNSGSVVNIITKSGTNAWHGSIYGNENNSVLNAMSNTQKRFTTKPGTTTLITQPPRSNEEFSGFTIGGPMIKDKMFLFGGFDTDIFSGNTIYTTGSLFPTPAGMATLAGCFPASTSLQALTKFGPYGISAGNPFPLPTNTTTGTFTTLAVGACAGVQFGGVARTLPTHFHGVDWILNWDWNLSATNQLKARYIFNKGTNFNANSSGTAAAGYPNDVPAISQTMLVSWTHNFSSHMINEARVSYGRLNVIFGGNSIGTVPKDTDIQDALAQVSFNSTFGGWGPANNIPQSRIVNTWQLQDNWNYVMGKHQLKAGVNWTYQRSPNVFLPALNGTWRFTNFTSFVNNTPNRVQIAQGASDLDFREYDTFLYFQDDWRVTQNLTLNLGLTWSYFGQPANLFNSITTKRESNAATAFWNPVLPLSVRTFQETPAYKHAFGPSVGFAYTPQWGGFLTGHGKTVFRGGYRLSYDPAFYNIYLNISSSAPVVFLQTISSGVIPPLPAVPTGPNNRAVLAPFITPGVLDPRTQNETNITPNFGPDRVGEWSFGVQRQITTNSVLEARYVGNHGDRQFQSINGNPFIGFPGGIPSTGLLTKYPALVPAGLTPCPATTQIGLGAGTDVGRINCGQGILRTRTNTGYSNYEGLQIEYRANNLFKQLSIRTGFTWSKTLDNTSEIFGTGSAGNSSAFSQSPVNFTNTEYGISGLNYPHRWTIQFDEQLPFFKEQHGVAGKIFGGWAFNGTYILASGQPFTPLQIGESRVSAGGGNWNDVNFLNAFNVTSDSARPFSGNPNAPLTAVGIFCGDVQGVFLAGGSCAAAGIATTQLVSMNAINQTTCVSAVTCLVPVTNNAVRYIINGGTAQAIFGTPFGNTGRNSSTDAISNLGNFTVYKRFKINERVNFEFHMDMTNVFNHFNFTSIDPVLADAGFVRNGTGFGDPSLTSANGRRIWFGGKITF